MRALALLSALTVVAATGLVHGLWTDRWVPSEELAQAAVRLEHVPDRLGPWQGKEATLDPQLAAQAGAAGYRVWHFTRSGSDERITLILLCGRRGLMAVHQPEDCYKGAGYEMTAPASHVMVGRPGGTPPAQFWTATFRRQEETRTVRLRIFWSWFAGGTWQAPRTPRVHFARYQVLYKLYVIRELSPGRYRLEADPTKEFLQDLIPRLSAALDGAHGQDTR